MAALYERPLKETEEGEAMYDYDDASTSGSGCGCFWLLGFIPQRKRNDNESNYLLQQKGELRESWWKNKLNKSKKDRNKFQSDPESYALNFDGGFDCEEDDLVLGFSLRFAAPIHNHEERWRTGTLVLIG
ncbi:uncharacterized protein LOC111998700 [Quercus suber]|uniref:uncharacterized protein LOC111998700 n=1 Tax=Quercus suber TaxID=58331 RepID=UPI0032DFD216